MIVDAEIVPRERGRERQHTHTYLFPHDISGLHDAAGGQPVVSGQQDGLLQCHTQGAAVDQRGNNMKRTLTRNG